MPDVTISVVIPTFDRRDALRRLLVALERQTLPPSTFEVVVAVDGSGDETLEMLRSFAAPYRLTFVPLDHAGRAAACNAAIERARAEIVVILDDDMEPQAECLAAHAREHAPASRRAVMGASPIVVDDGAAPHIRYVAAKFATHLENLARPGHRFRIRDFYSGNVSIPGRELAAVGGFDERFREYGNEDLELAYRLAAHGVAFGYSPDAVAVQHYDKTLRELARDELAKGRTAALFTSLHPDVAPDLKLGDLRAQRPGRRAARRALLTATRVAARTPDLVLASVAAAERVAPREIERRYPFVLEYFHLLGAEQERRERRTP